jgi:hypothetical protein
MRFNVEGLFESDSSKEAYDFAYELMKNVMQKVTVTMDGKQWVVLDPDEIFSKSLMLVTDYEASENEITFCHAKCKAKIRILKFTDDKGNEFYRAKKFGYGSYELHPLMQKILVQVY